jgi:hypothetical protein
MIDREAWYSARLLLESVVKDDDATETLFEDRVVLLRASSDAEAKAKAHRIGKSQEQEYLNADGAAVRWVFRELLDINPLYDNQLEEGSEVYSQLLDSKELKAVRRTLSAARIAALND